MENTIKFWIQNLLTEFKSFNLSEMAVFKVCLISCGMLIGGLTGRRFFRAFKGLIASSFISSYLYLIFRLLVQPQLNKKSL